MFCPERLFLVVAFAAMASCYGQLSQHCVKGRPSNCKEVFDDGCTTSGVYTIDPGCGRPFQVYCDMDGQWEVIQRRMDGTVNFYRNWTSYVDGFGNPHGEYWLGLENIHCLTTRTDCTQLKVCLSDFKGGKKFANYNFFSVGNNATNYRLNIAGYSGTAGDAMTGYSGTAFSTFDMDHDTWDSNCAVRFKGAWWYTNCHASNLNGVYFSGQHNSYADGVNWHPFTGDHHSLKYSAMKIRAV